MSAVWKYIKINDDNSKADCKLCSVTLSRGGAASVNFNTSNLIKHLKHNSIKKNTATSQKCYKTLQPLVLQPTFGPVVYVWCLLSALLCSGYMSNLLPSESCSKAKHFHGSHSGEAIADVFEEILHNWSIPKSS